MLTFLSNFFPILPKIILIPLIGTTWPLQLGNVIYIYIYIYIISFEKRRSFQKRLVISYLKLASYTCSMHMLSMLPNIILDFFFFFSKEAVP